MSAELIDLQAERSQRSDSAGDWTPAEMLSDLVKRLDSGEIAPTGMIAVYVSGRTIFHQVAGIAKNTEAAGVLMAAVTAMFDSNGEDE